MFGFGDAKGDKIEALEAWKKGVEPWDGRIKTLEMWKTETEPWGGRIKTLEDWKTSADKNWKTLSGWQTDVDKWRNTTYSELGRLEKKKLDVSDYEKQRDERDEKFRRLREGCEDTFPGIAKRFNAVEKEVARLGETTADIQKTIQKPKSEKSTSGSMAGRVGVDGGDPRGNIYLIQQQGHHLNQFAPGMSWVGLKPSSPASAPINRFPVYQTPDDPIWSHQYRDYEDEDGAYNEQSMPHIRLGFSRTTPSGLFKKAKKDEYELSIGGGRGAMGNRRKKRRSEYRY